jgi:hypothetical protein
MEAFLHSPQYAAASAWFAGDHAVEPPALPAPGHGHVERVDCAGWWRRATAVFIDLIIVTALVGAFSAQETGPIQIKTDTTSSEQRGTVKPGGLKKGDNGVRVPVTHKYSLLDAVMQSPMETLRAGTSLWLAVLYMTVLVGLAGHTFGMMIAGLRVVTTDFRTPGIWRALWRYTLALFLWWLILPLSALTHRVMLHDRWSGTRLITAERVLARAFTPAA